MDYKMLVSERADEIAYGKFNKEFYELSLEDQDRIFERALKDTQDFVADFADILRDQKREAL